MEGQENKPFNQWSERQRWVRAIWLEYWSSYHAGELTIEDLQETHTRFLNFAYLSRDEDKLDLEMVQRARILGLVLAQIDENKEIIASVEDFIQEKQK